MNIKKQIAMNVQPYLQAYKTIGFGSGSTVASVLQFTELEIEAAWSASSSTSLLLHDHGIFESRFPKEIEILIDGADQIIQKDKYFIKGGGGALMREKILWEAARKIIVVAEERKWSEQPSFPVAIEILPFAISLVIKEISKWKGIQDVKLRKTPEGVPFHTDNGNWILDVSYQDLNLLNFDGQIRKFPGVLETGIFKFEEKEIIVITERKEVKFS